MARSTYALIIAMIVILLGRSIPTFADTAAAANPKPATQAAIGTIEPSTAGLTEDAKKPEPRPPVEQIKLPVQPPVSWTTPDVLDQDSHGNPVQPAPWDQAGRPVAYVPPPPPKIEKGIKLLAIVNDRVMLSIDGTHALRQIGSSLPYNGHTWRLSTDHGQVTLTTSDKGVEPMKLGKTWAPDPPTKR